MESCGSLRTDPIVICDKCFDIPGPDKRQSTHNIICTSTSIVVSSAKQQHRFTAENAASVSVFASSYFVARSLEYSLSRWCGLAILKRNCQYPVIVFSISFFPPCRFNDIINCHSSETYSYRLLRYNRYA